MRLPFRMSAVAVLLGWLASAGGLDTETGQTVSVEGDEILVTARGRPTSVSQTPGSVGVISTYDIQAEQAVGIPDLFKLVPGVSRAADGLWGPEADIRGLSRESVVFLIDGCRVNTATDHGARFGTVDPLEIERIEILKGPISSLYGSGSIGGVVNVITRSGKFTEQPEWHGGLSGGYGSNPEGLGGFGYWNYNSASNWWYVSQSYRDYDSYQDGGGTEVPNSQFEDRESKLRTGYKVSDSYVLTANLQWFEGIDIGIPGTGTAPLPPSADVTATAVRRGLVDIVNTVQVGGDTWKESTLDFYYQFVDRRIRIDHFPSVSPVEAVVPGADHDTYGSRWLNILETRDHAITAGLDVWERFYEGFRTKYLGSGAVVEDKPLPDCSFLSAGAFLEDDWSLAKALTLNAGGRLDAIRVHNETESQWPEETTRDTSWTLHAGGTWKMTDEFNMKLVGASGYRAASLEERFQYLDLGGGVIKIGNPDLKPERSAMVEYGVSWTGDRLMLGASTFYNRLYDMIGDLHTDPFTIVKANVSEASIYGVEAETQWHPMNNVEVYGNIAWTVGKDTDTDEYLPYVAPLSGLAGIGYRPRQGFWAKLESVFSARQDQVPSGTDETAGWARLDTRVGWTQRGVKTTHLLYAGVNNIFDKDYRNYLTTFRGSPYDEPGRSIVAGYQVMF